MPFVGPIIAAEATRLLVKPILTILRCEETLQALLSEIRGEVGIQ